MAPKSTTLLIFFSSIIIIQTRVRLTHQASNFEQEIRKVEEKISQEKEAEADLIKLQAERAHVDESAAEAKRAEDKILRGTDKLLHWGKTLIQCCTF